MGVALGKRRPIIRFDPKKCTFCKICEMSCGKHHYGNYGSSLSRITIANKGISTLKCQMCVRCEKQFCIASCPQNALSYKDGNIAVDAEKCDSCGLCVKACTFRGIKLHPENAHPIICDLCGGDPSCVRTCPRGALSLVWLPESITEFGGSAK